MPIFDFVRECVVKCSILWHYTLFVCMLSQPNSMPFWYETVCCSMNGAVDCLCWFMLRARKPQHQRGKQHTARNGRNCQRYLILWSWCKLTREGVHVCRFLGIKYAQYRLSSACANTRCDICICVYLDCVVWSFRVWLMRGWHQRLALAFALRPIRTWHIFWYGMHVCSLVGLAYYLFRGVAVKYWI